MLTNVSRFCFKKHFIILFSETGREKERKRNITVWLPFTLPQLGTWPATQSCALTGNQTCDPLVHIPVLNPPNHASQGWATLLMSHLSSTEIPRKLSLLGHSHAVSKLTREKNKGKWIMLFRMPTTHLLAYLLHTVQSQLVSNMRQRQLIWSMKGNSFLKKDMMVLCVVIKVKTHGSMKLK